MIVLTTGKGGVGKTTISAATAVSLADAGHRTVVASVDPAHSLADVLDVPLSGQPIGVTENLDAVEVRLSDELREYWGNIQRYLSRVFQSQGVESWLAEDVAYLPGLEEMVSLLRLKELAGTYDCVVVDCPPTGSTLRYLNLPEAVRWYMEKFFPTERKIVQTIGPVAEKIVGVPMPTAEVLDQMQVLFESVLQLRTMLTDSGQAMAQVVSTPESIVLREAERAVGYLHVHNIAVGRVILNRCTAAQFVDLDARFDPIEVCRLGARRQEPLGLTALRKVAAELYKTADPMPTADETSVPMKVDIGDNHSEMSINIPPRASKNDLRVGRHGDDLVIDLGPVRRHVPLPPALARQQLVKAAWQSSGVRLEFQA